MCRATVCPGERRTGFTTAQMAGAGERARRGLPVRLPGPTVRQMTHPHFKGERPPWRHALHIGAWTTDGSRTDTYIQFVDGSVYHYDDWTAQEFLDLRAYMSPRQAGAGKWFNGVLRRKLPPFYRLYYWPGGRPHLWFPYDPANPLKVPWL
jgi:hypothetical protein